MQLNYRRKPNGRYVIKREEMDDIATDLLREYAPSALDFPQAVNIGSICEDGLFLTVNDAWLDYDTKILGMTAFDDIKGIPCLNSSHDAVSVDLPCGTVLLHKSLLSPKQQNRRRFTLAHEASHWILHRSYYSPTNQQFRFRKERRPLIACRTETIESGRRRSALKSEEDWIEWQADSLAAAVLMPLKPFMYAAYDIIADSGQPYLIQFAGDSSGYYKYNEIIGKISGQFRVSKKAAEIRLKQLGLIRNANGYAYGCSY